MPRKENIRQPVTASGCRAKKILALVPKSGRKSDLDTTSDSDSEIHAVSKARLDSLSSSNPPSLPSSFENLNLLSDEEITPIQAAVTESPLLPSPILQQPSPIVTQPSTSVLFTNVASPRTPNLSSSVASSSRSKRPRLLITRPRPIRQKPLQFKWANKRFQHCAEIIDKEFPEQMPKTPLEYFKCFFTDDILDMISDQTNLYSTQVTGKSFNISRQDIQDFIAINLFMGIVNMSAYTDYWSQDLRYEPIARVMSLKKFQQIRRYIHFNNNLEDDGDRYFKIRPLIIKLRENFLKVPHETRFSIDEMMVPYKGKKAGHRKQYIKSKPKKWGFKIFIRAGVSGFIYDFIVYGGEDTFRYEELSALESGFGLGAKIVVALCKSIPEPACSVVYFDNFFTSLELIHYLRQEMGIFSLGTIRSNRLRGAEKKVTTDKALKKKPRGSYSQIVCNSNKICIVKWLDNKCVTTASSYVEAYPVSTIQRYCKQTKKKCAVPCPEIIKHYNSHMGGVDLADMLIACFRTNFKGHRWYLPLVSQMLDMCVNNSWLLYRRHTKSEKYMPLKKFRYQLVQSLLMHKKETALDELEVAGPTPAKIIKAPVMPRPTPCVRYDQLGHFPIFSTKGRCKLCIKGQTTAMCSKCGLRLCLLPNRNCFLIFHTGN